MNEIHVYCHGGIGDLIVATAFLNLFKDKNIKVIIYTKFREVAEIFLDWCVIKTREEFPKSRPPAIWLEIIDIIKFNITHRNIISSCHPFIQTMFYSWEGLRGEWGNLIHNHPGSCNGIATLAVHKGLNRNNLCHYLVNQPYKKFEWDTIDIEDKFITVHSGFDESHKVEISSKSWNLDKFSDLVLKLKRKYPGIKVIQLGGKKHGIIKNVDENLAGKLPFRQSLRYLKSSMIHIDGDSGLVHARALFNKPSLVLFGPTNVDYFGYDENFNIRPNFCGNCFWLRFDWMSKCARDYGIEKAAKCMDSVNIDYLFDIASACIEENK